MNETRGLEMQHLHTDTMSREEFLRSRTTDVTTIWEHEFDEELRSSDEMRTFIESVAIRCPLNPRDAFKGGVVSPFKLHHSVGTDEKIHYYDVTSGTDSLLILVAPDVFLFRFRISLR